MFSYVSVEDRVPSDHPIRKLRVLVDTILGELDGALAKRYADTGRTSIPPERLLRASLLQVVYRVRSMRLQMEQLNYNLLFRWFVGLNVDDTGVGSLGVPLQPRTAVRCGDRAAVLRAHGAAGEGERTDQ